MDHLGKALSHWNRKSILHRNFHVPAFKLFIDV